MSYFPRGKSETFCDLATCLLSSFLRCLFLTFCGIECIWAYEQVGKGRGAVELRWVQVACNVKVDARDHEID